MSVFGPKQVEELILGNAVATEATVADFIATASEKEIKVLANDGGAAAEGKKFYLLQKTGGDASKGLNYEFSDRVDPKKIDKIILKEYAPEVQKEVTISGFTNVQADTLYAVNVRLYNESGALSTENFRVISGYYQTGPSVTGVTAADIRDGVKAALDTELESRGGNEFVTSVSGDDLVIAGKVQVANPSKDIGAMIQFDVTTKTLQKGDDFNQGLLVATTTVAPYVGNGTGKYAVNLEWFTKGYKYSPLRDMDPLGFDSPMYANPNGMYNAIHVKYYTDRNSPGVEVQEKVLTILVEKAADDAASNAPTNAVLADLRAFCDDAIVPSDLAVV
jgi:hypothetical protein